MALGDSLDWRDWVRNLDPCTRALIAGVSRLFPEFLEFAESPIEVIFALAILNRTESPEWPSKISPDVSVVPQVTIIRHRIDFVFYRGDDIALSVELDGFQFHERTSKDASRDRARDRELLAAGIPTARFTAGQIFKDAAKCLEEALSIVESRVLPQLTEPTVDAGASAGPQLTDNDLDALREASIRGRRRLGLNDDGTERQSDPWR